MFNAFCLSGTKYYMVYSTPVLMHDKFQCPRRTNRHNHSQTNNPCPTLFVANLGLTCSEKELTDVFSRFSKVEDAKQNGVPVAFVDFKDVDCSTGPLNRLQGCLLQSSAGEGMCLDFFEKVACCLNYNESFILYTISLWLLNKAYRYAKSHMGLQKWERKT